MPGHLTDPEALERFEYAAWADLVAAAPPELAAAVGMRTADFDSCRAVIAPHVPSPEFNRGLLTPGADLDALVDFLRQGADRAIIQIAAPDMTPERKADLIEAGCGPAARNWVMLARGPAEPPLPPTPLSLRNLGKAEAGQAGAVFVRGYGMPAAFAGWIAGLIGRPGWRGFGAFDGAMLVSVAFLFQKGERAIMTGAATLPEARGRGAQTALLALRLAEASRGGAEVIQSHTGLPVDDGKNPSLDNMRRAGFADTHTRLNWQVR